jgi:hypothetical protein
MPRALTATINVPRAPTARTAASGPAASPRPTAGTPTTSPAFTGGHTPAALLSGPARLSRPGTL